MRSGPEAPTCSETKMEREGTNRAQEVVARILAVKLPCAVQTEVAAYAVRVGRRGLPARGGREEGAAALLAGKAHVCRAARVACAPAERSSVEWLQEGDTKRQSVSAHRNMPDSPRSPPWAHLFSPVRPGNPEPKPNAGSAARPVAARCQARRGARAESLELHRRMARDAQTSGGHLLSTVATC